LYHLAGGANTWLVAACGGKRSPGDGAASAGGEYKWPSCKELIGASEKKTRQVEGLPGRDERLLSEEAWLLRC
jgi:hypothetical protein